MPQDVLVSVDGAIATVTLNRPDLGNAVTPAQASGLCAALEELEADEQIAVVILTGTGSTFNVGAYRPARGAGEPPERPTAERPTAERPTADRAAGYRAQIPVMLRVIDLLHRSRLVTIAAINGACAGAGMALALAADFRYAADSAGFNTAFVTVGLPGELGAAWFATRLVGPARARELFLLPARTPAADLAAVGLLNEVFAPEDLMVRVMAIAQRLAGSPPAALRGMKANLNAAMDLSLTDYLPAELGRMLACLE